MLKLLLPRDFYTHIQKRFGSGICRPKQSADDLIKIHDQTVAHNYSPLPVVLTKGRGVNLYDVHGKAYLDFLSGYASVSLGHCHPKLNKVLFDQAKELAHTSRAFYTRALAEYGEFMTDLFCYDKVLPMSSGTEAAETSVKIARKWGYKVKGIPSNEAKIIFAENNFWGRSIAAISSSNDPKHFLNYGPFVPCFESVAFNAAEELEEKFKDNNVCAFMVEPIQGEAGVIIPDPCYLQQVRELCNRHKVLMIADEVQCGLGRCGSLLCCDIYKVRPDILVLGKALSGGVMPVSAVLADSDIMDVIEPGTHGSTFGGNALGCRVAMAALKILQEEKLIENAKKMGEHLRTCLCNLPQDVVCEMRGIGLLNAIVLKKGVNAFNVCLDMMNQGLLVRTSRTDVIRLCPPLTIKENQIRKACQIIRSSLENSRGNYNGNGNFRNGEEKKPKKKFFGFSISGIKNNNGNGRGKRVCSDKLCTECQK